MNKLELILDSANQEAANEPYQPLEIWIGGRRLIDRVREVEECMPQVDARKLAGKYGSLLAKQWLAPTNLFANDSTAGVSDRTVLLICDCGCAGCWDFVCRMEVTAQTVKWTGFRQVHRDWDYSTLGEFVFDRKQYETAIAAE